MNNIIFFNSCKSWGGGEKWHFEMAVALKTNEMFSVSAIGSPKSEFSEKIKEASIALKTVKVSGLSFLNFFKVIWLARYFKNRQTDTVVINLSSDLKLAGLAAKYAGVKNIIYRRGSAIPIKDKYLNRYLFKNVVSGVLCNSEETKRTILQNNTKLFPKDKIRVIYNGLHTDRFENIKYKTPSDKIILGNLARLSKQKGQNYLINLARNLKNKGFNFELRIGGVGELEQELKNKVTQKGLDDVVKFVGFVSNPKDFLEGLDIFVFPSVWEGFGFSIVEAKLCKKPIVAFNISSNPEVIQDKIDGFLVSPFNEDEFFNRTTELIKAPELRLQMGERGRRDALENFLHDKSATEFVNYLLEQV